MTSDGGAFYSALDADSEGVEGKYYLWTQQELEKHLGQNADLIIEYYNVDQKGNWEHGANILNRSKADEVFIAGRKISRNELNGILKESKKILMRERNERVRPGLDDKIITAWNAMTISGLVDAYKAFDDRRFLKAALFNMRFLENEVMEGTKLFRSFKNKASSTGAFLDDYAALIQAQVKLYEVTFDEYWIKRADTFTTHVIEHFLDKQDGFFFYTSDDGEKLLARKKEIFDNVIPCSNSMMAWNLLRLGTILDKEDWKNIANEMIMKLGKIIVDEPNFMSHWGIVLMEAEHGLAEVCMIGEDCELMRQEFHIWYQPFAITMGTKGKSSLPLLSDKEPVKKKTTAYVCHNKTCHSPVHTIEAITKQLAKFT
jgi:uncharacterized protein